MNSIREIADWILSRDGFGIITHVSPDGDAFGSELALYGGLKKLGKRVCALCTDPVTRYCSFLPNADAVTNTADLSEYPFMISVDCADRLRLGMLEPLYFAAKETVCIDHHMTNPLFGGLNYVENTAATGEIIYRLLKELGVVFDREIATCLYTAIATDTGNFAFTNTTAESFRITADLLQYGIDLSALNRRLFSESTLGHVLLEARVIDHLRLSEDGLVGVSYIADDDFLLTGAQREDAENLIDTIRNIIGVEAAAVLKTAADGSIRVSMRGKSYADVSVVAQAHNGGGHKFAAGCTLEGDILAERDMIFEELCRAVKEKA